MSSDHCELLCLDLELAERVRGGLPSLGEAEAVASRAASLGDPTRLTLAAALREGAEMCVCDLSWVSGRAENLVSHHMRRLRRDGIVSSRKDGKMVLYQLTDSGSSLLDSVIASPEVRS